MSRQSEPVQAQLREHLAAQERDAADVIAHRLKGISGVLGAWRIESQAGKIMAALRADMAAAAIEDLAADLQTELVTLTAAVAMLPASPIEPAAS